MIGLLRRPWAKAINRLTRIHLDALREAGIPELLASLDTRLAAIGHQIGLIEQRQATMEERQAIIEQHQALIEEHQANNTLSIGQIDNRLSDAASHFVDIENRLGNDTLQIGQLENLVGGLGPQIGLIEERTILICDMLTTLMGRQVVPLEAGFLATRTPVGWIVLPDTEIAALLHLADGRNAQEPGTVRFLQDQLPPDGHVIDVGAHVGMLTVPMARAVAPLGRVDALEPVPRNAEALRRTIVANSLEATARVYEAAADAGTGVAKFALGANGQLGTLIGADSLPKDTIEVATVCLDDIKPPGSRIDVVKIDAEGAELRVLSGMRRIIADNPGLVVVAEFGPSHLRVQGVSTQDWLGTFAQAGLNVASEIDETARMVAPLRPIDSLERTYSINIAFSASIDALTPANRPP